MTKDFVLVLDVGSSKLRLMNAGRGVNNTFIVAGSAEAEYDGYYQGAFIHPETIGRQLQSLLNELDYEIGGRNNKIYIGVPAEFSSVVCSQAFYNLGQRRRIKKADLDNLFYTAGEKAKTENVEVVSVSALSYRLDEGRTSIYPIGEQAMNITAELSIIYCVKEFIETFNSIVANLGFESVEYISEPLAEGLFTISKEGREDVNMVINVGDLTTNVSFVKGEGLAKMLSFSIGGGHVTNDLSEAFDLTLGEADRLKRQIVLSLKGGNNDHYELTTDLGKVIRIPLNTANQVVGARLEGIAETIAQCVQMFSSQYIAYLPVYLTGAGVSQIKGGRDYLAKCLGRNISYGVPPLPGKEKAHNASIYSLVAAALGQNNE